MHISIMLEQVGLIRVLLYNLHSMFTLNNINYCINHNLAGIYIIRNEWIQGKDHKVLLA